MTIKYVLLIGFSVFCLTACGKFFDDPVWNGRLEHGNGLILKTDFVSSSGYSMTCGYYETMVGFGPVEAGRYSKYHVYRSSVSPSESFIRVAETAVSRWSNSAVADPSRHNIWYCRMSGVDKNGQETIWSTADVVTVLDQWEPDDTPGAATPLTVGAGMQYHTLSPSVYNEWLVVIGGGADSCDYFSVNMSTGTTYTFTFDIKNLSGYPDFNLYDAPGNLLYYNTNSSSISTVVFTSQSNQTVYFSVSMPAYICSYGLKVQ
jgi:hypothetical protein